MSAKWPTNLTEAEDFVENKKNKCVIKLSFGDHFIFHFLKLFILTETLTSGHTDAWHYITNVVHTPLTAGWPCWNGMISQCCRPLGCSPLYLKLYNTWKIQTTVPNKFPHHLTETLTLKSDVSQMKDSSKQLEDFPGVILWEHENLQSWAKVWIFHHVIPAFTAGAFTLVMSSFG